MESEAYIVLGPARTGTSLAAGLLQTLGVWLGDDLKARGPNNPHYYEDNELVALCTGGAVDPKRIVARLSGTRLKWGMKNPRLLHTWPRFQPIVRNPRFVVTHRRFSSHWRSYTRGIAYATMRKCLALRAIYYKTIRQYTNGHPRLDVWFEKWFVGDVQLERLANFVGSPITGAARRIIRPELRHYR